MKRFLLILPALLLSGCAELGARAITNATYLAEAVEGYVREVHDDRRWIRERCREMLQAQVMQLQSEGDFEGARKVLAQNYPPLVTFQAVRSFQDETGEVDINHPWGCELTTAAEIAIPPAETAPIPLIKPSTSEGNRREKSTVFLSDRFFASLEPRQRQFAGADY